VGEIIELINSWNSPQNRPGDNHEKRATNMKNSVSAAGKTRHQAAPNKVSASSGGSASGEAGPLIGALDPIGLDGFIRGWAWDTRSPERSVEVELWIDDNVVARLSPQDFRADLLAAGIGHGCFGFSWPVPRELCDGRPHRIGVHHLGMQVELENSPRTVIFEAEDNLAHGAGRSIFINGDFGLWPKGVQGETIDSKIEIGPGIWLAFARADVRRKYALSSPRHPAEETNAYYGVQVSSENPEEIWLQHQFSNQAERELSVTLTLSSEISLKTAPEPIAQRPVEIWLTRATKDGFDKIRRLVRGRVFRRATILTFNVTLSSEERQLLAASNLFLGAMVASSTGFRLYPAQVVRKITPSTMGFVGFEDKRLDLSFAACRLLSQSNNGGEDLLDRLVKQRKVTERPTDQPLVSTAAGSPNGLLSRVNYPFTQIIVPVFNGGSVITECLESLQRSTDTPFQVIIVNDGSDLHTSAMLRKFYLNDPRFVVFDRQFNLGYTKAVNGALKLVGSGWIVVLNSDTVVSHGWLARLHDAASARPGCGMVGPLSNAASWQSIPSVKDPRGGWSTNSFLKSHHVDRVQHALEAVSERAYPQVPLLNGFCTMISRDLFDKVGLLDEESFPLGYGEETDLCIRATSAGYSLVVADDCFVYHHKSVSFGGETRKGLSKAGNLQLINKHAGISISSLERELQENVVLNRLRSQLNKLRMEFS
jgi:GT2 family glycosyltransferase